ncbi:hypothetical protein [Nocardia brasiliensis]|uniref:hypothetical protein n=1 Tax=Nocardia brasiliensis TaxID=37326 RepID=UPI00245755C6|nr:hypothetical protein [Nocardia brasiliensis]
MSFLGLRSDRMPLRDDGTVPKGRLSPPPVQALPGGLLSNRVGGRAHDRNHIGFGRID